MGDPLDNVTKCPVTGLPVFRAPSWTNISLSRGYEASFALIGGRILLSAASGYAGSNGIPRYLEERERVLRESGLWRRPYLEIKDYAGIDPEHPRTGRIQFTMGMVKEGNRGYIKGFWGFNGTFVMRSILAVARRLVRYKAVPVSFVRDYAEAVLAAQQQLSSKDFEIPIPARYAGEDPSTLDGLIDTAPATESPEHPGLSSAELETAIDEVLRYAGTINWAVSGAATHTFEPTHPLQPIVDMMVVLKGDFDSMLREREEMHERVLRSAKLASIGTLTAGFAHELNTPLTTILGYASQIEASPDAPDTASAAGAIRRAAIRMKELVEQLCALNQTQFCGDFEPIDVNDAIRLAIRTSEGDSRRSAVRFVVELAPTLPPVLGSVDTLRAVVESLLVNALDALAEVSPRTPLKEIKISTRVDPDGVQILVRDNGPGMDQVTLRSAVDPFFTTKDVGRGVGLGLFVAYQLLKEMHGELSLSSPEGGGTEVCVDLPPYVEHTESS